jgi:hypothetical protein
LSIQRLTRPHALPQYFMSTGLNFIELKVLF